MFEISRSMRIALAGLAATVIAGCDGVTAGDSGVGEPRLRVLSGAAFTDTIDARVPSPLVVEVRDEKGASAKGVTVRFEGQPSTDPARRSESTIFACATSASSCGDGLGNGPAFADVVTDASGHAKANLRFGSVAGKTYVRVTVAESGLVDSAAYIVSAGAPARLRAPAVDTTLYIGSATNWFGRVMDRYYNIRAESPTFSVSAGAALTIGATTGVVTTREMGSQFIIVQHGALADSTHVNVVPTGRLAVWDPLSAVVQLVNMNGYGAMRTIASDIRSALGAFPHFDASRQNVTMQTGSQGDGSTPTTVVVVDTNATARRVLPLALNFRTVIVSRQLADGTLLVVAQPWTEDVFSLFRVDANNVMTRVAAMPGQEWSYGGADISQDGTRVAYLARRELRILTVATGSITVIETNARSPRLSAQGDRVAFLIPKDGTFTDVLGAMWIANIDGSARKSLGNTEFLPGISWSPDGAYTVARASGGGLRLLRVSDAIELPLRFAANARLYDFYQPDWR